MELFITFILFQLIGFTIYRFLKTTPVSAFLIGIYSCVSATYLFGLFNHLYIGRLLFFIIGITLLIYDYYKNKDKQYFEFLKSYFNLSNVVLIVSSVLFLVLYLINQPVFTYWDEYSFWGTSAKFLVEYNQFLPSFDYIYHYNETIIAGSSVLSYVFNLLSHEFNDYSLYFSYTVVILSTFALATEFIFNKNKNKYLSPVVFILFVFTVFLQSNSLPSLDYSKIHYAFNTSLVDFLLSIVAFSAILLYVSNKNKLLLIPALLVLTVLKDVGIFFSILSICIIACFELFTNKETLLIKKLIKLFIMCVSILVIYISWPTYRSHEANLTPMNEELFNISSFEYQKEETINDDSNLSSDAPKKEGNFILQVISSDYRTQSQNEVINDMSFQLRNSNTTFYINDIILIFILVTLGTLCMFLLDKNLRLSLLFINVGLTLGFIVYISAISLFIAQFNDGMVEYPRYSSTYYWLWIYLVLTLVIYVLNKKKIEFPVYIITILLSFMVYNIGLDYFFISSPKNNQIVISEKKENSSHYQEIFDFQPRILLISDRFNDYTYMLDLYYAFPSLSNQDVLHTDIDFSMSFSNIEFVNEELEFYYNIATDEEFLTIVYENFDYIYITELQESFVNSYGEFFNSDLVPNSLFKVNTESEIPFEVIN